MSQNAVPLMNPVFVWRSRTSIEGQRSRGNCMYCQLLLSPLWESDNIDSVNFEELDETMLAILRQHYLWNQRELPERQIAPTDLAEAMHRELQQCGQLYFFPIRHGCKRCGWWKQGISSGNEPLESSSYATLRGFDINDSKLALPEIRAHLTRKFSDIYALASRRFEEVIGDVYRSMGWEVSLTKQTRDGGVDLHCLRKDSGEVCVVECKRYAQTRTVSITVLRQLLGATVETETDSIHLVTTSAFSQPALKWQKQLAAKGHDITLVDGHELCRLLDLYASNSTTLVDLKRIFGGHVRHDQSS